MIEILRWIKRNVIMRAIFKFICILPIKKNRVFFTAFYGKKYACNPRAISEYLISKDENEFEIVWELNDETQKKYLPESVKVVKSNSIKMLIYYYTSKIIVNNCRSSYYLFKRKRQTYIQTWHGGLPLKKIEKDAKGLEEGYIKMAKNDSKKIDYLLSGSKLYTKIKRDCFWYDGMIEETGLPRCDILFNSDSEYKKSIREKFNLNENDKVILYAPTFRNNVDIQTYKLNETLILNMLSKKFGGEWKFIYKFHPNVLKQAKNFVVDGKTVINATTYADIQDLFLITDILITDFSSSMFDFMLMKKVCVLYLKDLRQYINQERGLYFDLEELPFPKCDMQDDLHKIFDDFDLEQYTKDINEFVNTIGCVESGHSCENVYNLIKKELLNKEK